MRRVGSHQPRVLRPESFGLPQLVRARQSAPAYALFTESLGWLIIYRYRSWSSTATRA